MFRTPGVVLINPKFPHNVGGTIRPCSRFGIESLRRDLPGSGGVVPKHRVAAVNGLESILLAQVPWREWKSGAFALDVFFRDSPEFSGKPTVSRIRCGDCWRAGER